MSAPGESNRRLNPIAQEAPRVTAPTPEPVSDEPEQNNQETPDQQDSPEEPVEESEDSLPDWARAKLAKANKEAASYRTQLRDAQAALSKAKTAEEFDAVVADFNDKLAEAELNAARTAAAFKYSLPDALVARLQGNSPEELEADAKALAALVTAAPKNERLRGGLNPAGGSEPESYDPKKLAAEVSRGYGLRFT